LGEEVFDAEEFALANEGDGPLVGVGAADAGEVVAGFERYSHTGGAAHGGEAFQAIVFAFTREHYAVQPSGARPDGFLDRMQAVKNFHPTSLLLTLGLRPNATSGAKARLVVGRLAARLKPCP
jgi:hypothetical protein